MKDLPGVDPRCAELALGYEVRLVPDAYQGYRATFPMVPDVDGTGATPSAALEAAYAALRLALDWHLRRGEALPERQATAVAA
jgi:predicted RNase H-like HicB family nuclease